jgi:hypothetical protein
MMNDDSRKRDENVHLPLRIRNWLSADQTETVIRARLLKERYSDEVITTALTAARQGFSPNPIWKDAAPSHAPRRGGMDRTTLGVVGLAIGIIGSCIFSTDAMSSRGEGSYVIFPGFIVGGLLALWSGIRSSGQSASAATQPPPAPVIQYQMTQPPESADAKTRLTFLPQTDKFLLSDVEFFCNGKLLEKVKKIGQDTQPLTYEVEPGSLKISIKAVAPGWEKITSQQVQVDNVQTGHHIQVAWTTSTKGRQLLKNSIKAGIDSQLGGGILEALFFGGGYDDKSSYELQLVLANKKSEAELVQSAEA